MLNETTVENATLDWLAQVGYTPIFGGDIAPGEPAAAVLHKFLAETRDALLPRLISGEIRVGHLP